MPRIYGGMSGYGAIRDADWKKVRGFHLSRVYRRSPTPEAATLDQFCPPIMDQGSTSSCTGHAASCCIYTSTGSAGRGISFVPSQKGCYDIARMVGRHPNLNGTFEKLVDEGASPEDLMKGIGVWGVWPMAHPKAPDGRFSDAMPEGINKEPTLDLVGVGRHHSIVGQWGILTSGDARVFDIQDAISDGSSVAVAIPVYENFESFDGIGVYSLPQNAGPDSCLGWHYVSLIGYRTVDGKPQFRLRNSWGASWAEGGSAWVDTSLVSAMRDLYVMAVNEKEAEEL